MTAVRAALGQRAHSQYKLADWFHPRMPGTVGPHNPHGIKHCGAACEG